VKVYYTHRVTPTCFGHSCSYLQGGTLQRTDTVRYVLQYR